jgi:hypothetical protein
MRKLKVMMFAIISVILVLTGCEKDEVVPIVDDVKVEQSEEKTALKDEKQLQEESEETKEHVEPNKADEEKTSDSERIPNVNEENKATESKVSGTGNSEEKQAEEPTKKAAEQNTDTNTSANKPNATPEKESTTTKSDGKQIEPVKEPNQAATTPQKSQPNVVKEPTAPRQNEKQPTTTVKEQTPSPQPKKEEAKQTVTVSIVGEGTILSSTKVEISEGNTVLDVTSKILKEKGIPISVRGSGSGAYVEGINNLYEFDRGPLSGWEAKRNGAKIDKSAGAIKVGNGDTIQWIYTTDYKEAAN